MLRASGLKRATCSNASSGKSPSSSRLIRASRFRLNDGRDADRIVVGGDQHRRGLMRSVPSSSASPGCEHAADRRAESVVAASLPKLPIVLPRNSTSKRFAVAARFALDFGETGQIIALVTDDRNRARCRRVRACTTARRCAKFQSGSKKWGAFYTALRECGASCGRCRCRVRRPGHVVRQMLRRCPPRAPSAARSSARVTPYSGSAVITSKSAEPTSSYRYFDGSSFCGACVSPA